VGTAESGVEGKASVGGKASSERSHHEVVGILGIDEIEAGPVVAGHLFVKTLGDAIHERLGRRSGESKALSFLEKLFLR
jgi:hypothetical protein